MKTWNLRLALRSLVRRRGFSVTVILLLALGIGFATSVLTLIDRALLAPLPFPDDARLVMLWETHAPRDIDRMWVSPPNAEDWRAAGVAERLTTMQRSADFSLSGAGEPERLRGSLVSSEFFATMGVEAARGHTFLPDRPEENRGTVVLSHALWQRRFGAAQDLVGRSLTLNGKPQTVVGVMPESFDFPRGAELWAPLLLERDAWPRSAHFLEVVARLGSDADLAAAQAEMNVLAARLEEEYPDSNSGWGIRAVPLREELVGKVRPALLVLLGAVALVLVITSVNASNLVLARSLNREPELAVRTALGASRPHVVRLLLTESLLLTGAAGVGGLLLTLFAPPLLLALSPVDLGPYAPRLDLRIVAATLAVTLLSGLVVSVLPAWRTSRVDLRAALQGGVRTAGDRLRNRWSAAFVVLSVGLSLVLLIGTGLLLKSLLRLRAVDAGFDARGVLTAELTLPGSVYGEEHELVTWFDQLLERLAHLPGVAASGLSTSLPLTSSAGATGFYPSDPEVTTHDEPPRAVFVVVSPGYFASLGIPVLRGRDFDTGRDRSDAPRKVIVSQRLARMFWPNRDPVGQQAQVGLGRDDFYQIVGVVGDVHEASLDAEPRPAFYLPYTQFPVRSVWLTLRATATPAPEPTSLTAPLRLEVWALDRDLPVYNVKTMAQWVADATRQERFLAALLATFSIFTLVLAGIGVYGVIAFNVARRSHEIAIRVALGAGPQTLVGQLVREGAALTVLGLVLGLGVALFFNQLMDGLLYGVSTLDPATLTLMPLGLLAIALCAVCLPAQKAARVEPRAHLQSE